MIVLYIDAHVLGNVLEILFAHELVVDAEATSMLESRVQVGWAHELPMLVSVATVWRLIFRHKMLDNDWLLWADLK